MFYILYQTTNLVNGKTYVGKHKTADLNDSYLGSGKLLLQAIDKYGAENFSREILFVYQTEDEVNAKEAEIVTEDFCKQNDTYNLCVGGRGGFSYINRTGIIKFKGKKHSAETRAKLSEHAKKNYHKCFAGVDFSKTVSAEQRRLNGQRTGSRPKSDEHRRKISESVKKRLALKNAGVV